MVDREAAEHRAWRSAGDVCPNTSPPLLSLERDLKTWRIGLLVGSGLLLIVGGSLAAAGLSGGSWNDVASWLEAISTTAGFAAAALAALLVYRTLRVEQERDRARDEAARRSQAALVAAWADALTFVPVGESDGTRSGWALARVPLCFRNASHVPVTTVEVNVSVHFRPGRENRLESRDWGISLSSSRPPEVSGSIHPIGMAGPLAQLRHLMTRTPIDVRPASDQVTVKGELLLPWNYDDVPENRHLQRKGEREWGYYCAELTLAMLAPNIAPERRDLVFEYPLVFVGEQPRSEDVFVEVELSFTDAAGVRWRRSKRLYEYNLDPYADSSLYDREPPIGDPVALDDFNFGSGDTSKQGWWGSVRQRLRRIRHP